MDLSDGQRSLFHIALTAATLEVEKDVFGQPVDESSFEQGRLRRTSLTFLAIEELENSLSPFFLSRIVTQAREIGALTSAQVGLSSHSPAILSRIEPEEVRFFRLDHAARRAHVRSLKLPVDDGEARQYVRLAVRAHPELYFARFVVLGEGDSERILIPAIAEAMNVQLDRFFVPIVPLAGRHVSHLWRLLGDLQIPHATLLDIDLGRAHGGAALIVGLIAKLREIGTDLGKNSSAVGGAMDPSEAGTPRDVDLLGEGQNSDWLKALREEGIFFSFPLDIDFAMLRAFPSAYQNANPGGRGPLGDVNAIRVKKATTLKTGGHPELYDDSYDDAFKWYPYLFLSRSKPDVHMGALARLVEEDLREKAPPELKALIDHVRLTLQLDDRVE